MVKWEIKVEPAMIVDKWGNLRESPRSFGEEDCYQFKLNPTFPGLKMCALGSKDM